MKKRFYFLSWLTAAALLVLCFSCSAQKTIAQKDANQTINTAAPTSNDDSTAQNRIDTSKWKIYKDAKNNFSFQYPPNLILQKKASRVRLSHSIKFRYQDPCDERDNAPLLNKLIDFDIAFTIVNKDYDAIVREKNGGAATEVAPNADSQKNDADEGDFTEVGKLKGEFFWLATEGCGGYEYVYPLGTGKSLILRLEDISIFNPVNDVNGANDKALKNPNVINPAKQNEIIRKILESVDF